MQITPRRRRIIFFVVLGICLVAIAITLNVGWIILHWRQGLLLFFGVIFFAAIILGLILNTGFLVREIRLNEQHDSFINAVTHELKTPITSIRLYLETLQRRDVDETQRQHFYKLMLDDTDRLRGTVDQVLKAGEVRYRRAAARNPVEIDFPAIVGECMDLARSRHHLQPAALHWRDSQSTGADANASANANGHRTGDAAIKVRGDADELRTAITNILDNAIKYSGPEVDVSVGIDTPDPQRVILRVRDRGVGIPAGELKRIFKRFYRVPRSRATSHAKGTGLGLFIVRAIARAHGGKVFAESAGEARGTTVTLELPRSAA